MFLSQTSQASHISDLQDEMNKLREEFDKFTKVHDAELGTLKEMVETKLVCTISIQFSIQFIILYYNAMFTYSMQ